LLVVASVSASSRFESYAAEFATDLVPGTPAFIKREAIFFKNAVIVDQLNEGHNGAATFSLDESPFSHLTFEEFAATRLPRMPKSKNYPGSTSTPPVTGSVTSSAALPAAFDWRTASVNAVTPVKDQGAMGSCWAFSAVGNVEGQRAIASKGAVMDDLSVEQLIECDNESGAHENGEVHEDCGVFGGWPYLAYQYWMKAGGVRTAKEMPYCSGIQYGQPGCCLPCMVKGYNQSLCGNHDDLFCNKSTTLGQGPGKLCSSTEGTVAKIKSWHRVPNNATAIAEGLAATGPLSIALDATLAFQFYKRGVLDPSSHPILGGCADKTTSDNLNHAVLLVGYGVDGSKDYWTVKNSWGAKWGEDGYFRFIRGTDKCGIESEATTAIVE